MKGIRIALSVLGPSMIAASDAYAHGDHAVSQFPWTLDLSVVFPLLVALAAFVTGLVRVRARAGSPMRSTRCVFLFLAGWCVLASALVSPLHAAGERSFAAHMTEHELLMLVAAPLLVAAHANGILLWSLPHAGRITVAQFFLTRPVTNLWQQLTRPLVATLIQAAALWLWHAPLLFDLALSSPGWHIVQHLSFLISALLFWSAMLNPQQRRKDPATAIGCLFATAIISGALGALMAFSTSPWYAAYRALGLDAFGLSAAQDQQIAGVLMWIPGGLVHTAVALVLLAELLRAPSAAAEYRDAL